MISILIILLSLGGLVLMIYGGLRVLNAPIKTSTKLKGVISIKELGLIEGGISNLKEVIIIADRIEEPTNELYNSVKKNLKNGVKYTFLVSSSKYENEKNSYLRIFQGIAEAIKHNYQIESVINIHPLNFEWKDYPYIFYRFIDSISKETKAFAFMGTQVNEGIADEYEQMNPTISLKMLNLAFDGVTIEEYQKIDVDELRNAQPKLEPPFLHKAV